MKNDGAEHGWRSDCMVYEWVAGIIVELTFRRRIKSRLTFAGIIRSSPYSKSKKI